MIVDAEQLRALSGYADATEQTTWLKRWDIAAVTEEGFDAALQRQAVPGIAPGEETPEDIRAYEALRARKLTHYTRRPDPKPMRTPAWADLKAIDRLYAEARRLTAETGIQHSVDHFVPLCGRLVTGLHVETNLQIITLAQNMRKGNRWEDV